MTGSISSTAGTRSAYNTKNSSPSTVTFNHLTNSNSCNNISNNSNKLNQYNSPIDHSTTSNDHVSHVNSHHYLHSHHHQHYNISNDIHINNESTTTNQNIGKGHSINLLGLSYGGSNTNSTSTLIQCPLLNNQIIGGYNNYYQQRQQQIKPSTSTRHLPIFNFRQSINKKTKKCKENLLAKSAKSKSHDRGLDAMEKPKIVKMNINNFQYPYNGTMTNDHDNYEDDHSSDNSTVLPPTIGCFPFRRNTSNQPLTVTAASSASSISILMGDRNMTSGSNSVTNSPAIGRKKFSLDSRISPFVSRRKQIGKYSPGPSSSVLAISPLIADPSVLDRMMLLSNDPLLSINPLQSSNDTSMTISPNSDNINYDRLFYTSMQKSLNEIFSSNCNSLTSASSSATVNASQTCQEHHSQENCFHSIKDELNHYKRSNNKWARKTEHHHHHYPTLSTQSSTNLSMYTHSEDEDTDVYYDEYRFCRNGSGSQFPRHYFFRQPLSIEQQQQNLNEPNEVKNSEILHQSVSNNILSNQDHSIEDESAYNSDADVNQINFNTSRQTSRKSSFGVTFQMDINQMNLIDKNQQNFTSQSTTDDIFQSERNKSFSFASFYSENQDTVICKEEKEVSERNVLREIDNSVACEKDKRGNVIKQGTGLKGIHSSNSVNDSLIFVAKNSILTTRKLQDVQPDPEVIQMKQHLQEQEKKQQQDQLLLLHRKDKWRKSKVKAVYKPSNGTTSDLINTTYSSNSIMNVKTKMQSQSQAQTHSFHPENNNNSENGGNGTISTTATASLKLKSFFSFITLGTLRGQAKRSSKYQKSKSTYKLFDNSSEDTATVGAMKQKHQYQSGNKKQHSPMRTKSCDQLERV